VHEHTPPLTQNQSLQHPFSFRTAQSKRESVVDPTQPKSLKYADSMRATSADRAFEFRIQERHGKIVAQVYRNSSHSFDTTRKVDRNPNWEFASVDEANEWAERHCADVLKVPGQLHWT